MTKKSKTLEERVAQLERAIRQLREDADNEYSAARAGYPGYD